MRLQIKSGELAMTEVIEKQIRQRMLETPRASGQADGYGVLETLDGRKVHFRSRGERVAGARLNA